MFVDLVQVYENTFLEATDRGDEESRVTQSITSRYSLRTVSVNTNNILFIRDDDTMKNNLVRKKTLPPGLDLNQRFSKIFISGTNNSMSSIVVVGSRGVVIEKIMQARKQ